MGLDIDSLPVSAVTSVFVSVRDFSDSVAGFPAGAEGGEAAT